MDYHGSSTKKICHCLSLDLQNKVQIWWFHWALQGPPSSKRLQPSSRVRFHWYLCFCC